MSRLGPGSALGDYVIEAELGRGGMGVVYRGHHRELPDTSVALKLILSQHAEERELVRFEREAQAMARVRHPNVVGVHGLERAPAGLYLIAELVEGEPLDRRLERGPLEPREAARIVAALCGGVSALHAAQILHRDLKPANVILRPDGAPVLLDFGIAQDQSAERLTQTGTLLGSPHSMSPEQAAGETGGFGPWTDVYGLGAVLYALLNGEPPFPGGGSVLATIKAVLTDPPAWPRRAELPADLVAIGARCLAKEPDERYSSPAGLVDDLERWLNGRRPRAAEESGGRGRPLIVAAALGLALLAGGGGLYVWRRRAADAQAEAERKQAAAREAQLARDRARGEQEAKRQREAWRRVLARFYRFEVVAPLEDHTTPAEQEAALGLLAAGVAGDDETAARVALFNAPPSKQSFELPHAPLTFAMAWPLGEGRVLVARASLDLDNRQKPRDPELLGWLVEGGVRRPLSSRRGKWNAAELVEEEGERWLWALSGDPALLVRYRLQGAQPPLEEVLQADLPADASVLSVGPERYAIGFKDGSARVYQRGKAKAVAEYRLRNDRLSIMGIALLSGGRVLLGGARADAGRVTNDRLNNNVHDRHVRELSLYRAGSEEVDDLDAWLSGPSKPCVLIEGRERESAVVGVTGAWYVRRVRPGAEPAGGFFEHAPGAPSLLPRQTEASASEREALLPHTWSPDNVGCRGLLWLPSGWLLAWGGGPVLGGYRSQVRGWDRSGTERVRWGFLGQIHTLRTSPDGRTLTLTCQRGPKVSVEVRRIAP